MTSALAAGASRNFPNILWNASDNNFHFISVNYVVTTPGAYNVTDTLAGTLKFAYFAGVTLGVTGPVIYSEINQTINTLGSTSYVFPGLTGNGQPGETGVGMFIYNYAGVSYQYTLGKIIYSDTSNVV